MSYPRFALGLKADFQRSVYKKGVKNTRVINILGYEDGFAE